MYVCEFLGSENSNNQRNNFKNFLKKKKKIKQAFRPKKKLKINIEYL